MRTSAGASRNNFSSEPCSAGCSLPLSVNVLFAPWTLALPVSPRSAMVCSMCCLNCAALEVSVGSIFLGAGYSTIGSTLFASTVVAPARPGIGSAVGGADDITAGVVFFDSGALSLVFAAGCAEVVLGAAGVVGVGTTSTCP